MYLVHWWVSVQGTTLQNWNFISELSSPGVWFLLITKIFKVEWNPWGCHKACSSCSCFAFSSSCTGCSGRQKNSAALLWRKLINAVKQHIQDLVKSKFLKIPWRHVYKQALFWVIFFWGDIGFFLFLFFFLIISIKSSAWLESLKMALRALPLLK